MSDFVVDSNKATSRASLKGLPSGPWKLKEVDPQASSMRQIVFFLATGEAVERRACGKYEFSNQVEVDFCAGDGAGLPWWHSRQTIEVDGELMEIQTVDVGGNCFVVYCTPYYE